MSLTGRTSIIDLPDGTKAFRKALPDAPAGFFQFEATGLQTLGELGARVPQVYEVTDDHLDLELIPRRAQHIGRPTPNMFLVKSWLGYTWPVSKQQEPPRRSVACQGCRTGTWVVQPLI